MGEQVRRVSMELQLSTRFVSQNTIAHSRDLFYEAIPQLFRRRWFNLCSLAIGTNLGNERDRRYGIRSPGLQ